jgi:hypothetical protein
MSTSRDLNSYKKTHNLFIDHVTLMVWLEAVDYLELIHLHPKGVDKLGSEASLLCACVRVCASPLCPDRRSDVNQGCKPSLYCLNNSIRSSTFICRNSDFASCNSMCSLAIMVMSCPLDSMSTEITRQIQMKYCGGALIKRWQVTSNSEHAGQLQPFIYTKLKTTPIDVIKTNSNYYSMQ